MVFALVDHVLDSDEFVEEGAGHELVVTLDSETDHVTVVDALEHLQDSQLAAYGPALLETVAQHPRQSLLQILSAAASQPLYHHTQRRSGASQHMTKTSIILICVYILF